MRTQSFRPRVRRLTFQAIAGGEEIHCHGGLHHFPSACKLVRSLRSRCDCDHKKGVFYDWVALPVLRAKITFPEQVRAAMASKPRLKRGTSSCDLWPDGRGAAWPYARSGCSRHFAAQGARLSRLAGVAARGRAISRTPVYPSDSRSRTALFSRQ